MRRMWCPRASVRLTAARWATHAPSGSITQSFGSVLYALPRAGRVVHAQRFVLLWSCRHKILQDARLCMLFCSHRLTVVLGTLVQYYMYETYAPAGTNPPHAVTAVTAKVSLASSSCPH